MRDALVLVFAIVVGFVLLGYDRRTDDTGVEVALLLATSMALAVAAPLRWIAVALGVGLPITLLSGMPFALVVTLAGALLGYLMRRGSLLAAR